MPVSSTTVDCIISSNNSERATIPGSAADEKWRRAESHPNQIWYLTLTCHIQRSMHWVDCLIESPESLGFSPTMKRASVTDSLTVATTKCQRQKLTHGTSVFCKMALTPQKKSHSSTDDYVAATLIHGSISDGKTSHCLIYWLIDWLKWSPCDFLLPSTA